MNILKRKFLKFDFKSFSNKLKIPLPFADIPLSQKDPELFDLVQKEQNRQWIGIELIASENYTSRSVMECLGKF